MAPLAATLDLVTRFSPFGKTPAVNLAQNLPPDPEAAGKLLLLGCEDVRNVLFTVFSDSKSSRQ